VELKKLNITPAKEKQFNKKGINDVEDLLNFTPRKYYDFTKETGILPSDEISCIVVHVKDVKYYNNSTPLIIANCVEEKTNSRCSACCTSDTSYVLFLYRRINS
jgi:RecG-like helicase